MDSGSLIGSVLGHYRVDALIGRGGMGEVYRGHDTTLDRAVALKVLAANVVGNADSLARFIQEARAASSLNHPNILTIHEIGEASEADGGANYIVSEFVTGETLRALLHDGALDISKAIAIVEQIASPRPRPWVLVV